MRLHQFPLLVSLPVVVWMAIGASPALPTAEARAPRQGPATDSVAVAAAIARFHDALASGDSTAALSRLTDDVTTWRRG